MGNVDWPAVMHTSFRLKGAVEILTGIVWLGLGFWFKSKAPGLSSVGVLVCGLLAIAAGVMSMLFRLKCVQFPMVVATFVSTFAQLMVWGFLVFNYGTWLENLNTDELNLQKINNVAKNARWGLTFLLLLELATLVGALFLYWCHPNTRGHNYDNFGEKSATFSSVQERFGGLRSALEKNADRGNTSSGIKLDDRMKQKYANTMHSPDEL